MGLLTCAQQNGTMRVPSARTSQPGSPQHKVVFGSGVNRSPTGRQFYAALKMSDLAAPRASRAESSGLLSTVTPAARSIRIAKKKSPKNLPKIVGLGANGKTNVSSPLDEGSERNRQRKV